MLEDSRLQKVTSDEQEFTPRAAAALLLATLLGLVALYFLALQTQVPKVSLEELEDYEDQRVKVEAHLTAFEPLEDGSGKLRVSENNASAEVFLETGADELSFRPGDRLLLTGTVQRYQERLELMVEGPADISVLEEGKAEEVFLTFLAQEPWRYQDTQVRLSGEVKYNISHYRFQDDDEGEAEEFITFFMADNQGRYSLKVRVEARVTDGASWERALKLGPGSSVELSGILRYSSSDLRYYLDISGEGSFLAVRGR